MDGVLWAVAVSGSWAKGSNRQWRELRAFVLSSAGYRCQAHADGWCARSGNPNEHTCTVRAELSGPDAGHAHHTKSRAITGDDPRYIVAACQTCNLHIGDPTKHPDPEPTPRTRW